MEHLTWQNNVPLETSAAWIKAVLLAVRTPAPFLPLPLPLTRRSGLLPARQVQHPLKASGRPPAPVTGTARTTISVRRTTSPTRRRLPPTNPPRPTRAARPSRRRRRQRQRQRRQRSSTHHYEEAGREARPFYLLDNADKLSQHHHEGNRPDRPHERIGEAAGLGDRQNEADDQE